MLFLVLCGLTGTDSSWVPGCSCPAREDLVAQAVSNALNVAAGSGLPYQRQTHCKESPVRFGMCRLEGQGMGRVLFGKITFSPPTKKPVHHS